MSSDKSQQSQLGNPEKLERSISLPGNQKIEPDRGNQKIECSPGE